MSPMFTTCRTKILPSALQLGDDVQLGLFAGHLAVHELRKIFREHLGHIARRLEPDLEGFKNNRP